MARRKESDSKYGEVAIRLGAVSAEGWWRAARGKTEVSRGPGRREAASFELSRAVPAGLTQRTARDREQSGVNSLNKDCDSLRGCPLAVSAATVNLPNVKTWIAKDFGS